MFVKDVISESVAAIGVGTTLEDAAHTMLAHSVDALLVMDGERLAGIIGVRDLFTVPLAVSLAPGMPGGRTEYELQSVGRSQTVRNQMDDQVLTVDEELPVIKAAPLMVNLGKHPLPVLRGGRVIGAIDRWHTVRAILELEWPDAVGAADPAPDGAEA